MPAVGSLVEALGFLLEAEGAQPPHPQLVKGSAGHCPPNLDDWLCCPIGIDE